MTRSGGPFRVHALRRLCGIRLPACTAAIAYPQRLATFGDLDYEWRRWPSAAPVGHRVTDTRCVCNLPALAGQLTHSIGELSDLIAEQVSATREQIAVTREQIAETQAMRAETAALRQELSLMRESFDQVRDKIPGL